MRSRWVCGGEVCLVLEPTERVGEEEVRSALCKVEPLNLSWCFSVI